MAKKSTKGTGKQQASSSDDEDDDLDDEKPETTEEEVEEEKTPESVLDLEEGKGFPDDDDDDDDEPVKSGKTPVEALQIISKDDSKSNFTESSIQWYLEEINKIPLLTREEEDTLARRAIKGEEEAKNRLVVSNMRFVVQVAKKYQKYGISLLDLINEGNMGLIKAAERFDPDMGFHFISYAVWWIRQAIILAINQKAAMIRLPMNRTIDLNRIEKIQKEMENELGTEPTLAQVAERLDMPEEEVKWLKQLSYDYVSLDAPLTNDSESTQMSTVEDEKYDSPPF